MRLNRIYNAKWAWQAFALLLLCSVLPVKLLESCGWYGSDRIYQFRVFEAVMPEFRAFSRMYYTRDLWNYEIEDSETLPSHESNALLNTKEWYSELDNKVSMEAIYNTLYLTDPFEYLNDSLIADHDAFTSFLKAQRPELAKYLYLIKKSEALINNYDPWSFEYTSVAGVGSLESFTAEAEYFQNHTKDPFILPRLAFLMMRVSYYSNNWDLLNKNYESYFKSETADSWLIASAKFYHALTLQPAERNLEFVRIFDMKHERQTRIIELFHRDQETMIQSMIAASTEREKSNLKVIYELRNAGRSMNAAEDIYEMDPDNRFLPFLVFREINKIEDWLYTNKLSGQLTIQQATIRSLSYENSYDGQVDQVKVDRLYEKTYESDFSYARDFYRFLGSLNLKDQKSSDYVRLCRCHLGMMLNKTSECAQELSDLKKSSTLTEELRDQIEIDEIFLDLVSHRQMTAENERRIMKLVKKDPVSYDHDWDDNDHVQPQKILLMISSLLEKYGHQAEAFFYQSLSHEVIGEKACGSPDDGWSRLLRKGDVKECDRGYQLMQKKNKSNYEKWLTSSYFTNDYGEATDSMGYRFLDIKSTIHIQRGQWQKAYDCIKDIPNTYWQSGFYQDYCQGDPFLESPITRDINHDKWNDTERKFTKRDFLKELLQLQNRSAKGQHDNGMVEYQMGNAMLNLTSKGSFWFAYTNWSCGNACIDQQTFDENFYECKSATRFYKEAMKHTQDRTTAVMSFWALRYCEKSDEGNSGFFQMSYERKWNPFGSPAFRDFDRKFGLVNKAPTCPLNDELTDCGILYYYHDQILKSNHLSGYLSE